MPTKLSVEPFATGMKNRIARFMDAKCCILFYSSAISIIAQFSDEGNGSIIALRGGAHYDET